MNAVLIPFFLAAYLVVDEPWPYGPEYTFQVRVNASAFPGTSTDAKVNVEMQSRLICQPKAQEKLSCRFNDTRSELFLVDSQAPEIPMEQLYYMEDYTIDEQQFELIFEERGLDGIVANRNIHKRQLDIVRTIVGQFNFGTNLRNRFDRKFRTMENFTNGECESSFEIHRKQDPRAGRSNRSFEIAPQFLANETAEIIEILRSRNLEICAEKFPYYFGSCAACHLNEDANVELKTSDSRMMISGEEFISSTSKVIRVSSKSEPTRWNRLCEDISLRLEMVQAAAALPPDVESPMTTDIFTTRWFITNTSTE